ncbi:hypothetical protein [Herbaspirillum sp.]|jgi:hypothetical protein|uniref:hypothetical protein n=1 Tax=Herbaspirillum TaxID=963 RepID=UPI002590A153|nr:hypothetical protein [Herbaspirillum sp.]MCP3657743.1 hypothetical protein [Herbaspirillum sp.]MCP3949915.1 hypothetical protein [Herbaspirillum sp.]MCP4035166.1 hypothetical protein [Herbaspirillum sp.]MCP4556645.1 hypothetical protein [Herbaspirillum sp.]
MRITLPTNSFLLLLLTAPLFGLSAELPTVSEERLSDYRAEYENRNPPMKYLLIHADGSEADTVSSTRSLYLLDLSADATNNVIASPEIDELIESEFFVEIQSDSLLSQGKTDYLVLSMSRPAEYNPRYFRCAAGHGEDRAYLFSISDGKAKVLSKFFGGCATSYELMRDGNDRGYRVIERGEKVRSVRYMLRGDTLVREPDYQEKGSPR